MPYTNYKLIIKCVLTQKIQNFISFFSHQKKPQTNQLETKKIWLNIRKVTISFKSKYNSLNLDLRCLDSKLQIIAYKIHFNFMDDLRFMDIDEDFR